MARILRGKDLTKILYDGFRQRSAELKEKGMTVKAAVISATDDPAVGAYTAMIKKSCERSDVGFILKKFESSAGTEDITDALKDMNTDKNIHGIIVMLPLWDHIDPKKISCAISPLKDIDGVNPFNAGRLVTGEDAFAPNTAQACKDILEGHGIKLSGKHVVIIGRSNIVGKPLANMLVQKGVDATVTLCHSKTADLKNICRSADILIAAIGSPRFITKDYTHAEQIVIDVGMNEVKGDDGTTHLTGDVDYENVKDHVFAITPVPGGVSPLTNAALINNVLKAASLQQNEQSPVCGS